MLSLPTVLLRHETRSGAHFDWLLADPRDPTGKLWTARVAAHSQHWTALRWWDLEPLAPHRRVYLKYEGEIPGGRGSVTRVDEGTFISRLWTDSRIIIELRLGACTGGIELRFITAKLWRAALLTSVADETDDQWALPRLRS